MAVGDLMKLGVALPIHNWSMRRPCKLVTTLVNDYLAGHSFFITQLSANSNISHYLKRGDIIVVGPSSAAGYEGRVGVGQINSVGGGNQVIMPIGSNLVDAVGTVQFESGDSVSCVGSCAPAGWATDCLGGDPGTLVLNGHDVEGYDDKWYSLNFTKTASSSFNLIRLSSSLSGGRALPPFEPSAIYFVSVHMKSDALALNGGAATLDFLETSGSTVLGSITLSPHSATWVERTAVLPATAALPVAGVGIEVDLRAAVTCTNLKLDCLVACHAKGTDDAASGIYTFDEYPIEGSVRYDYRNTGLASETLNESRFVHYPGGPDLKHVFRCEFDNIGQALRDNLLIMELWQRRGNLLVLAPNIQGLPPYIYGNMYLSGQGHRGWDLTKSTVSLQFIEA